MRKKVILGLVVAVITMLLVAFSGCGGCGKKATKPPEEEQAIEEETPATSEISEVPEETPVTTPEISETPAPATTPQPPVSQKKNKGQAPKAQPQPQAQQPQVQPQPPEYEYQVLWEEQRNFRTRFSMWGETKIEEGLIIPEDVITPQEIDITALFNIHTPDYYSSKIQEEGAIVPLPLEGEFTPPNIVNLKLNYDPNTQFYPGEYCLEVGIKEKNVTVQTASGSKVIDTSKTRGWDMVYMAFEANWPKQVSLSQSQKDVKNIEALIVIPPQNTQIEVPAKLSISKLPPGTKKNYEVPGIPEDIDVTIKYTIRHPEAEINGKLVIAGEVQK